MLTLSKKQNRAAAIALLLLALCLGALALAIPGQLLRLHLNKKIESQAEILGRYQRVAATREDVQLALDQVRKKEGRKHFLKNTGAALAASEIQESAKSLIEANGGRLISMQIVPTKEEGAYRKVTVNVQLFSNVIMLRKILYTLETAQPYLLVDNVSIRPQPNAAYKGAPVVEPEAMTQFDLSGYALVVDGK